MPAFDPRTVRRAPVLWMLLAAAVLAALLAHAHLTGDVDPTREQYGANFPGDLAHSVKLGAVEWLVLTALLRPWSYRRAPGRTLLALVLWTPWALFALVVCMHCGPIGGALALWRLGDGRGAVHHAARLRCRPLARPPRGTPACRPVTTTDPAADDDFAWIYVFPAV